MNGVLELGSAHRLRFTAWKPDRNLNPQYDGIPDYDKVGALVAHPRLDDPTVEHESAIMFDLPDIAHVFPDHELWTVVSWEPLTLTPSLLCTDCGDHGHITEGRWVGA